MKHYTKANFKLFTFIFLIILIVSYSKSIFSQNKRDSLLNERISRIEIQLQKSEDSLKILTKKIETLQNLTDKTFKASVPKTLPVINIKGLEKRKVGGSY